MRLFALAMVLVAGCGGGPADEYDDFRERTKGLGDAAVTDAAIADAGPNSRYAGLCGKWLLRSLLQGGIDLGLRLEFTPMEGEACPTEGPATLKVRIWLERHQFSEPEILTTTVDIDEHGRFDLIADPLILDKEVLRGEVDVRARLIMHSRTVSGDEWCGDAEGSVTVPITLDLAGSTFLARRDDDVSLLKPDLPFRCVDVPPPPDAGVPDAAPTDGGPADAEPPPPTPDLSGVAAQAADLTGHWLVNVQTGFGVPLKLWLALTYSAGAEGGWLDGALRTTSTMPGAPPLATFGVPVDTDGRFIIWLPDARLTGTVTVEGDILFAGATLDADHFCGAAAGEITSPFERSLEGTTFGAERWTPGTEVPTGTPNRCP